ncbi:unnamed protein product [Candidula unifasciata]|uniref:proteasome endopeptidase complex n=1 Tax=Candidula unifasciata TaxID=100452 RepID=A0A8S3ZP63_9EUPU|nr:unnamed protein product [Candidula unifasciata]
MLGPEMLGFGVEWMNNEVSTGTTIMATQYDRVVVVGADSRTTTTTSYIANRVTHKLTGITDYIYCCRSGSAADTQAVADLVKYQIDFHRMEMGKEPLVKTVANIFKQLCYDYRDQITAGIIVAGCHSKDGDGMPFIIGGSCSSYLYGYVDANFKPAMTKEQSLQSSGGIIRLASISTKDGVERHVLTGDKVPTVYEEY